ncbi:MAG: hypothetical protein HY830_13880 [Actinobacteria bacterium]|nr:hypothetical protein [Actinomycetota bacterium]
MAKNVLNPPPNWPAPPVGWRPPPGWQPDPAWGEPPAGWTLWVRANPRAFAYAALAALPFAALQTVLVVVLGRRAGADVAFLAGAVLGRVLVATVATGLIAFLSASRWRWWYYVLVTFVVLVGLATLSALGSAGR